MLSLFCSCSWQMECCRSVRFILLVNKWCYSLHVYSLWSIHNWNKVQQSRLFNFFSLFFLFPLSVVLTLMGGDDRTWTVSQFLWCQALHSNKEVWQSYRTCQRNASFPPSWAMAFLVGVLIVSMLFHASSNQGRHTMNPEERGSYY